MTDEITVAELSKLFGPVIPQEATQLAFGVNPPASLEWTRAELKKLADVHKARKFVASRKTPCPNGDPCIGHFCEMGCIRAIMTAQGYAIDRDGLLSKPAA